MKKNIMAILVAFIAAPALQANTANLQQEMEKIAKEYENVNRLYQEGLKAHTEATKSMQDTVHIPQMVNDALVQHLAAKQLLNTGLRHHLHAIKQSEDFDMPHDVVAAQHDAANHLEQADLLHASAAEKIHGSMNTEQDPAVTAESFKQAAIQHSLAADKLERAGAAHRKIAAMLQTSSKSLADTHDIAGKHIQTAGILQRHAAKAITKIAPLPGKLTTLERRHQAANNQLHQVAIAQQKANQTIQAVPQAAATQG